MHAADDPRRLAHDGRPLARAGTVVEADVERHADEADVHRAGDLVTARAHEGGDVREPRHDGRVDRLKVGMAGHVSALRMAVK